MLKLIFWLLFNMFLISFNNYWWIIFSSLMLLFVLLINFNFLMLSFFNINSFLGSDLISMGMVMLSIWIFSLVLLSMCHLMMYKKEFMLNLLIMLNLLFLTFFSLNFFFFYIFFEFSLIPMLFIIVGWGYQVDRVQAGLYLFFYTILISLPMFMCLLKLYNIENNMNMMMIKFNYFIFYMIMMMAFLVKMPMFFLHLWLLKAHVEAPVGGSMVLAGILLKLGGYGLFRLMFMMIEISMKLNYIWILISIIGGFYMSLMCFFQVDMKLLIACSSVVHMSLVIGGMLTMNSWGLMGGYLLMIGHGLSSSGLFCMAGYYYEYFNSRSLLICKGLLSLFPILSMWMFMLICSNMAAPPSLNLFGEISLINSIISWSSFMMLFVMLISFFSFGYSLYLYSYSQHGLFYVGMLNIYVSNSLMYLNLLLHYLPLNLLFLKLDFIYLLC
uniref:NADH-ubiquinone oxidoreductase chain 4 n=1 Tax=Ecnomus latus TaxID=623472 RepID=A0A9E8LNT7_9NEOP|nr:NADH dehydrogenase subunit 4 [Ecnomus latus]UZZ43906.1 NADH dehydrogenase subunit 4 [Ecnomus latus]